MAGSDLCEHSGGTTNGSGACSIPPASGDGLAASASAPHGNHIADVAWSIDTQRHYEQELHRARQATEDARREKDQVQSLLEMVMAAAPIGFAFLDREGRYIRINHEFARMHGMAPDAATGLRAHDVLAPDAANVERRAVQQVLETGQPALDVQISHAPSGAVHETGTPGDARGGTPRHWLVDYYPVRTRDGCTLGVGAVATDITGLKQAEAETERRKEDAEAANRAKDHFLAILSHEMRTPLTPVLTTVASLAEDMSLPAETRGALQMVRRNVAMEARLIDDLLDITRIVHGKLQVNAVPVDARLPVGNAIETCLCEIHDKQLAVVVELDAERPFVKADPARLQQVVWNLLRNAVKFTPAHGRITVRCHNDERGWLQIQVSDSGIGIDPQALSRIFLAFEQGEPGIGQRFGGLGLGLTISRALVEAHGGKLTACSEGRNRGATFTVHLPALDEAPPDAEVMVPGAFGNVTTAGAAALSPSAAPATGAGSASGVGAASGRILLVEDHADTLRAMKKLLQQQGYQVFAADSVTAGQELAEREPIDLLISDIGLPDGTGLDLLALLRKTHPTLKAIALSGFGMEDDLRRSREAGFQAHVTKPIDLHTLKAIIAQLLRAEV
jgi:PAS domain S-box-containing protein